MSNDASNKLMNKASFENEYLIAISERELLFIRIAVSMGNEYNIILLVLLFKLAINTICTSKMLDLNGCSTYGTSP